MSNCYECDTPLVTVCPQCNPDLSAITPRREGVRAGLSEEAMAIIMFEAGGINVRWTDPHVTEGRRALWRAAARKALSLIDKLSQGATHD